MSASDLGAPYFGERLWLFATSDSNSKPNLQEHGQMARMQKTSNPIWTEVTTEDLGVVNGMAFRSKQFRAIGNGQCPAMVVEAWNQLINAR